MTGRHRMGLIAAGATLLAAAPLAAIYDQWTWLFQALVVVGATAIAAALVRALRAPVWVQPPVMVLGLLAALTWLFPSGEEILALLPSPGTLSHFAALAGDAPTAMRTNSLPAPDDEALLFVTALGIGLVAVMVDLCAVMLRRPALAGLPMLAIYSVPVAVRTSAVPPLPFVIGAAGYLWLLGADHLDRVRRFGRRFSGDGQSLDAWAPSPLAAAGRRLTVIGVALAVVLPLAAPGLSGLIDRAPGGFGSGSGIGSGSGEVDLFAELTGRLNQDTTTEMLRVTTDDPDPFYLRFAVATEIDDRGFAPAPPSGYPVAELASGDWRPASAPATAYTASVEITYAYHMPMAPTYHELVAVSGLDAEWLYDPEQQIVFSPRVRAGGLRYDLTYLRPRYSPADLRMAPPLPADDPLQRYTETPAVPEVTALVAELTEDAQNSYDRVLALFRYFSVQNGFRYSLETGPETTGVAIVDFLENKTGFCVQYAAALAWMVRSAGIPARVAFGFTRGSDVPQQEFALTNRNLHAWTEVYFPGAGWVPFDATPSASVRGGVDTDWASHPDSPAVTPDNRAPDPGGPDDPVAQDRLAEEPAAADGATGDATGSDAPPPRWPWLVAVGLLLMVALGSGPAARRASTRRRRLHPGPGRDPRQRAHHAWDELLDTLVDLGWRLDPTETPRATAARMVHTGRLLGPAADDARLLALAEERARYAREPLPSDRLVPAVHRVAQALGESAGRPTRWRARALPPSVVARWRVTISEVAAGVRRVVARGGRWLGRISPRRVTSG